MDADVHWEQDRWRHRNHVPASALDLWPPTTSHQGRPPASGQERPTPGHHGPPR
ncbi:hypothetical protein ACFPM0_10860 [Pseudonocardia sulfidoxydans]|uniref:hypothetical protein n=1 Tax=Pseudonocardia sulfidoxydans TaxID=54011 RepID=UPI00360C0F06